MKLAKRYPTKNHPKYKQAKVQKVVGQPQLPYREVERAPLPVIILVIASQDIVRDQDQEWAVIIVIKT
jgi:hypothetical protein